MIDLRKKFTKWYYRKGYTMQPKTCDYGDGVAELVFYCPWWVRLLAHYFFSPSVYYAELLEDVRETLDELKAGPERVEWPLSVLEEEDNDQSGMEDTQEAP